jgi:hypothetical protein
MSFSPSLRANGSRECAPDDRLHEAMHFAVQRKKEWIASSLSLLAMTALKRIGPCDQAPQSHRFTVPPIQPPDPAAFSPAIPHRGKQIQLR